MAGPEDSGMERADMKRMLTIAAKAPVHCAVALPKQGALALLLMAKARNGKALSGDLKDQFADLRAPRWGTVSVDPDAKPKTVVFELNKAMPGLARRLVKTLKGTGFNVVNVK